MKPLLFLLLLSLSASHAQTPQDSLSLRQAQWQTQVLPHKMIWKYIHFQHSELFKANQSINILEIPTSSKKLRWKIVTADSLIKKDKTKGQLRFTSKLAQENNAFAAINGGFFDVKKGGSVDFVKINGRVIDTTRAKTGDKATFHGQVAVVIHRHRLQILKGQAKVGWEYTLPYKNVLLSGPLLILGGNTEILSKNARIGGTIQRQPPPA